jgi:hypothetical protein
MKPKLPKCPPSGEGVHRWVYACCHRLQDAKIPVDQWEELIAAKASRPLQPREVANAAIAVGESAGKPAQKWPALNAGLRADIIAASEVGLAELWEQSPLRLGAQAASERVLSALFEPADLLCCGASSHAFTTRSLLDWTGKLESLQFIVPNPMLSIHGRTQTGKLSSHSLSNIRQRCYQVVEFDRGTFDEHAAILWHLSEYAPLVMAVHSGGKSLHGWFRVTNTPESQVRRFFEYAVQLGADRATWTPSQFVRMPDGRRVNGERQSVIYFQPHQLCQT